VETKRRHPCWRPGGKTGRAGEPGEAVKTPRRLLSLPIGFYISIQQLMIDLVWDSIRHDRGFQQLLAGKEKIGQTSK